ncbi:hypothetical protein E1B28_011929 [Marasmius oreades]|uniref:Zn(2)-C6 fungal-type domain-containing protein n=1 Tax=Marasmius oreades TaxID=181124 RepID=A0A9P7RQF1_9AGAR|nr:uncharacterized protein E1B28_011929 [Marasmius oreades]KAG7087881.1 hypothetical protein E1B28_011929 [Marasmius oreades]
MSSGSTTPVLRHRISRACGNCRTRKIKCDGMTPQCTPCAKNIRSVMEGPCDYGDTLTQVETLEKNIHRLENRLRELGEPALVGGVQLNNPYTKQSSSSTSKGPLDQSTSFAAGGPPPQIAKFLLETFLFHAHDFAFFLNIGRVRASMLLPHGHPKRPTRGLTSVICLMGFLFSTFSAPTPTPAQTAQIAGLLSNAINEVTNMTTTESSHPFIVVQSIQAELLVATYLLCSGRHLEGQFHLTRANSLAIGARLHKVRSNRQRPYPNDVAHLNTFISTPAPTPSGFSLPPTSDPIEEGERINAFWSAFVLSNCWDATVASSMSLISVFGDGNMEVDSPWPMDMLQYEQGGFPSELQRSWTVQNFLSHISDDISAYESSHIAMYSKASVLFKRSRTIALQLQEVGDGHDPNHISGTFTTHGRLIDSFISSLPSISSEEATWERPTTVGMDLAAYSLAHSSTIQLHSVLIDTPDPFSLTKSLMAAKACVEILKNEEVEKYLQKMNWINPVMGILWDGVCGVFLKCMGKLRSGSGGAVSTIGKALGIVGEVRAVERGLVDMFEALAVTMQAFASRHLSIQSALEKNLSSYRRLTRDLPV